MKKTAIAFAIGQALFVLNAYANETETATANTANNTDATLEEIIVRGTPFSQQIGTQKINEQQIARMPTTNGNITELLKSNPNVIFSDKSEMSNNAGEIRPDEVSFHGEKFYNNNFMIDGISNNDNLNPGSSARSTADYQPQGTNAYDLPAGDSQSFWVNTNLLKSVEVFDSNISAKYGSFTGGVVNAELKDPDLEKNSGSIAYRTTRSNWAKFHTQDSSTFESASRLDYQPSFTKHSYNVSLNQKFADNFGVIVAYDRTTSDILYAHPRLRYVNNPNHVVTEQQKRLSETLLVKGIYFPENGDVWRATLMYSPHKGRYYKANALNSGFDNTGGGFSGLLQWDKQFNSLKMVSALSYKRTGNEIQHDADVYRIYRPTASIDWLSGTNVATTGGYGNTRTLKETYTLKQDYSLNEFDTGSLAHKIIFGWQTDFSRARYDRNQNVYNYTYTANSSVVCNGANECIDGEQLATAAILYPIRHVSVNDSTYSAYLEDQMKWKRLELNLGVRADYNQYLKNLNFSPRFSVSYDVFGNDKTHLFGGVSRYYANSMLAYKLREGIGDVIRFNRVAGGTWTYRSAGSILYNYSASNLRTPYTDEFTLGFGQKIANMNLILKWVHRNAKDQFARVEDGSTYRLGNAGWSRHNTVTLMLNHIKPHEFKYAKIDWALGASYSKGVTNNKYYDASTDESESNKAIYNGVLMDKEQLPNSDYNTRVRVFMDLNTEFPKWRLAWTQRLTYQPPQKYLVSDNTVACPTSLAAYSSACGSYTGEASVYEDAKKGSQFLVDWRIKYTQPLWKQQTLDVTVDVNNVFDRTAMIKSTGSRVYYKMGRNFWLGAQYNF